MAIPALSRLRARRATGDALLWALTFAVGTALLTSAAIVNGGPILYPDSLAYILDSENLVRLLRPTAVRPVFYGLAIWPLHWERNIWPVLFAQGLVVAHIVYLTVRAAAGAVTRGRLLLILLALAVATPVPWYVAHVLPDLSSGVMVLALFLLGFCRDRLNRAERIYLVLLGAASTSFHLTNLVTAGAVAACGAAVWLLRRDLRPLVSPVLLFSPLGLAVAALLAFSALLYGQLSVAPRSPPHMMARLIADGPGRAFLHRECPTEQFQICRYLDQLPATEDGILWSFLPKVGSTLDPTRFRREDAEIVRGTMRMFPLQVARNMAAATVRQLLTFDSRVEFPVENWADVDHTSMSWVRGGAETLQSEGVLEGSWLDRINGLHALVAGASAILCLVFGCGCARARLPRPALLIGVLLIALPANAFATGALGGVFSRYAGRVIWLVPLAAIAAGLALYRTRGSRTRYIKSANRFSAT